MTEAATGRRAHQPRGDEPGAGPARPRTAGAALLDTVAAVEPLYWTSFYERARFYRGRPRPELPEIVFDLTKDCPLACSFCFAADTFERGRRLGLAAIDRIERAFAGVPRATLLGGEPLTHPEIGAILERLAAGHDSIEIYTSGVALPADRGRHRDWLKRRFGHLPARFTLTLSVDRFHRTELGDVAFNRILDTWLDLARDDEAPVDVRFNVTAADLSTAGYLVVDRVESCLAELHEGVAAWFLQSIAAGKADQRFGFNPIVRMGRAADRHSSRRNQCRDSQAGQYSPYAHVGFSPLIGAVPALAEHGAC